MNFKFQIGDHVVHSIALIDELQKSKFDTSRPTIGRIVERHSQECYGGVQLSYGVRFLLSPGPLSMITEPELELWTMPKKEAE